MPRNAPASLGDNVYLDIVAHVLKENGFPASWRDLAADGLDGIRVLPGRPKPPPPVGDFSYVEVVGCLTTSPRTWMLTRASEPVAAVPAASGGFIDAYRPRKSRSARTPFICWTRWPTHPMATGVTRCTSAACSIKLPDEQRMAISSFEIVPPTCGE